MWIGNWLSVSVEKVSEGGVEVSSIRVGKPRHNSWGHCKAIHRQTICHSFAFGFDPLLRQNIKYPSCVKYMQTRKAAKVAGEAGIHI